MLTAQVQEDVEYTLVLEHKNSIIQMSSFFDCPHVHMLISMITVTEARERLATQTKNTGNYGWLDRTKEESKSHLLNRLREISEGPHQE